MQTIQSEKQMEFDLQETINNLKINVKMLTAKNDQMNKENQTKQENLNKQIKTLVQ